MLGTLSASALCEVGGAKGGVESAQVVGVGVGTAHLEVLDEHGGALGLRAARLGLGEHGAVAVQHGLAHLALAHERARHLAGIRQLLADAREDGVEVLLGLAVTAGAKEEDAGVVERAEKGEDVCRGRALVGPGS